MAKKRDKVQVKASPPLPQVRPGKYADGMPFDQIGYLECKIILKPNHFTSRASLFDFGKLLKRPARDNGISFQDGEYAEEPLKIREVLFLDTADFRLYNNAFILRRRIPYRDGFPDGDPEIVFKFRHPDLQKAAEIDVRPRIPGDYRIKFKAEALPLKDEVGGIRVLYSHNVEFPLHSLGEGDRTSLDWIAAVLPPLKALKREPGERVELVSGAIVEEVQQDVGVLDFGNGFCPVANVALWRTRGEHRPLIGEFAFQLKFRRREELNALNLDRGRAFFKQLQWEARDWLQLGATKTGIVYHLKGNPPNAHE
ncbi:hypothetical protein [Reyranella sp.]|jgi:hypothetical protein|uniref:hypothetical protein n=1 Tax=Reyranella sp. TaxID=1929291 RepID=UPI002F954345